MVRLRTSICWILEFPLTGGLTKNMGGMGICDISISEFGYSQQLAYNRIQNLNWNSYSYRI
jgi:hypothetical protein